MTDEYQRGILRLSQNERRLSIIVHSLFSSWVLSFLFEGQILYSFINLYGLASEVMIFGSIAAIFTGLAFCGFIIKTKKAAKRLFLFSYPFFLMVSGLFFFPPSALWTIGIIAGSLLAGGCLAAWGFYFKSGTPKNERIKTAADVLILSNILMILFNITAIHISPRIGLVISMLMLPGAFVLALRLPADDGAVPDKSSDQQKQQSISIAKLLMFLCLFITAISIDSGLMYQVINPAFANLEWLTSWYWAVPYIIALIVMRNLSPKINRSYVLYVAIAMIGLSFIGFICLDRSAASYLVVNTLMLGAYGVYDLFWWSILGEMLEFHKNPAMILGIGLSSNVLGVLLGGLIGRAITSADTNSSNPMLLSLAVVCVTLAMLPPLHKQLSSLLKGHAYLTASSEMPAHTQTGQAERTAKFGILSERESQVAELLLHGKTYRAIAGELNISENTVKYYVKNIYTKFNIQSRAELIDLMWSKDDAAPRE